MNTVSNGEAVKSDGLIEATQGKSIEKRDVGAELKAFLDANKQKLEQALPRHLSIDRLLRLLLNTYYVNPDLAKCTLPSIIGGAVNAVSMGLEPGPAGECYLVPFYSSKKKTHEAQFIIGYKGLMKLARRSGEIGPFDAYVVHEKDDFDYALGSKAYIKHRPCDDEDPGPVTHAWALATYRNGQEQFVVLSRRELDKLASVSKAKSGPRVDWPEEMDKKGGVRRLCKMLPSASEVAVASEGDEGIFDWKAQGVVRTDVPASIVELPAETEDTQDTPDSQPQPEPKSGPSELDLRQLAIKAGHDAGALADFLEGSFETRDPGELDENQLRVAIMFYEEQLEEKELEPDSKGF